MNYQKPEMIMIELDVDDVIRTSPTLDIKPTDPDEDIEF